MLFTFVQRASLLVVTSTAALACARPDPAATTAPAAAQALATYYVGTTATTSPDGQQAYGPARTIAVRRTVDPARRLVEEHVVHPGEVFVTVLRRRPGDAAVFDATDQNHSFTGTVTFTGPEWAWTGWTYDLAMSDGSGTLRGSGRLTPGSLDTDKTFVGPDGQPRAQIHEHLEEVDEATYTRTRAELSPP